MSVNSLIVTIKTTPGLVDFEEVIGAIAQHYHYTPTRFSNGAGDELVINEAGTNEGSCKIFSFASLNGLSRDETLACFGKYYREDVLLHPEGQDHSNIRAFMKYGWDGVQFDGDALVVK